MQISKRLGACAELVRKGAVLADVGTDHAYLPIYLLKKGSIRFAHLCDVNEGPLARAKENAMAEGLLGSVEFHLTSGAGALASLGITDYCICGMGGELIADIIAAAPALFDNGVNLILQPMTRPEALRAFLFENGFEIISEHFVAEDGKFYLIINSSYTGTAVEYTAADAHFGKTESIKEKTPEALGYMRVREAALLKKIRGIEQVGGDASAERELLLGLHSRIDLITEGN